MCILQVLLAKKRKLKKEKNKVTSKESDINVFCHNEQPINASKSAEFLDGEKGGGIRCN